jgi:hypothetical protein
MCTGATGRFGSQFPTRTTGIQRPIAGSQLAFDTSVFVNCPFDAKYLAILRPILIRQCRFGIHDLSRLRADKEGEFYRLNMPFELGLDVGCRTFGSRKFKAKRCLILETERYRYQAAISDLSNSDIGVHNNEPEQALGHRGLLPVCARLAKRMQGSLSGSSQGLP